MKRFIYCVVIMHFACISVYGLTAREEINAALVKLKSGNTEEKVEAIDVLKENLGQIVKHTNQLTETASLLEKLSLEIAGSENQDRATAEKRLSLGALALSLLMEVNKTRLTYFQYTEWEKDQFESLTQMLLRSEAQDLYADGLFLASLGREQSLQRLFSDYLPEGLSLSKDYARLKVLSGCLNVANGWWSRAESLNAVFAQKSKIKELSLSADPDVKAVASDLVNVLDNFIATEKRKAAGSGIER